MKVKLLQPVSKKELIWDLPESEHSWIIGRGDGAYIQLSDRSVSRSHAVIAYKNGSYSVKDCGSRSGSKLNGKKLESVSPISHNDKLLLGSVLLEFSLEKAAVQTETKNKSNTVPLPSLEQPNGSQCLYSAEAMALKRRIHTYVLEKLDLPENALQDMGNEELIEKLDVCLEQTLRELRHELLSDIPLDIFQQALLDELIGYGPITPLLRDPKISEIMINGHENVFVESKGRLYSTGIRFFSEQHLQAILQRIVEPLGRHVDVASPMVDARLPDGSRVNAIIPPLAIHGSAITIRKFSEKKLTTDDLIQYGSMTREMAIFLEEAVRSRQNILVSGGTGSGKTTLLNILSQFISSNERVITVEDSAELKLSHSNLVSLEARPANVEGQGKVTIRDLVVNTLRMRPDRIIVGECRGAEALDMLQAMNTGHDGSLTTCHANNPRDALSRLENMVMMAGFELPSAVIREQIASAIDLIVQQSRMPDGSRKIIKISEVTGREGNIILLQDIFSFEQTGFDEKGNVTGFHTPTGNIPCFIEELRNSGDLRIDMSVFVPLS